MKKTVLESAEIENCIMISSPIGSKRPFIGSFHFKI